MLHNELIDALHREGEEKLATIRLEAGRALEEISNEAAAKARTIRERYNTLLNQAVREEGGALMAAAAKKAAIARLIAEKKLADRLYTLAAGLLKGLRNNGYDGIFGELVRELPTYGWDIVTVNPEDLQIGAACFPDAKVVGDNRISGGLEVMSADGKVRVINTFEKRLELAWAAILPEMMENAAQAAGETRSAQD
ncbi:MAG: hypothetical protein HY885_10925 [Deltaproteobacteria bacterium]|nr:hypothetical protein [Deltaproteobacteria bacterium]